MPTEEATYREGVMRRFDGIDESLIKIDRKVSYTNGKVRKIIIALVLIVGIVIGQTFATPHDIIELLSNIV